DQGLTAILTTIIESVPLQASYAGGNHEAARFPCETIEMDLNVTRPDAGGARHCGRSRGRAEVGAGSDLCPVRPLAGSTVLIEVAPA
ncbi:MAG: hypothetical protein ACN6OP_18685, partial [Pseudomonadales bacterium]